ncbi:MAG TPA: AI-2E family transporter [Clostridiales bacterium]|nr:AI-2E family transporter [Clostridiales bacterium]
MKFRWDRKYLYWGVTAFCVIALSLIFFWTVTRWDSVRGIVRTLVDILNPILIGIAIAYILTPVLNFFEKKFYLKLGEMLFPRSRKKAVGFARVVGIVTVILLLIATIATLLVLVLPQIYLSIQKLVLNMQGYYNTAMQWLENIFNTEFGNDTALANILSGAVDYFTNWVKTGLLPRIESIIANVSTGVISVLMTVVDILIGIMLSCYVLYRKEELIALIKKLTYSIMSRRLTYIFFKGAEHIHKTFGRFFVGKLICALIVGIVCAIFMLATRMPYAILISVIIAVTNIIPFFGPYIGGVPSAFLILLESPVQCVIFVVFCFVLQTFEGNILEPRIVGGTTGLSGFWVIFSILLFGGLFGFIGLLCGVPLFAVIYTAIGSWSKNRLKKKNLPTDTEAYMRPGQIEQKLPEAKTVAKYDED